MIYNKEVAIKTAEFLLQIKAIKLNLANPFQWASGWKSPIYCDNRKTLSYPKVRNYIRQETTRIITDEFGNVDAIAGVATGGIANGALVAQALGLPFVYVRSEKKSHGLTNQVEGVIESGQSVIVIEDLVSTGGSSLKAVKALREIGCNVKGMIAIFTYGFQKASDNFKEANCKLYTLSDYNTLIDYAVDSDYVQTSDIQSLNKWREDPSTWGI